MESIADQVSIFLCRMFANVQSIQTSLRLLRRSEDSPVREINGFNASVLLAGSSLSFHTLLNISKRCSQFAVFVRQLLRKFVRPLFDPINSCAQVVGIFSQGDIFWLGAHSFLLAIVVGGVLVFPIPPLDVQFFLLELKSAQDG